MRRAATILLAFMILGGAVPASSHLRAHQDPEDAPGRDLRKVRVYRTANGRLHGMTTTWPGLYNYGGYRFEFDSRGDGAMDYYVKITYDGGSFGIIAADLYRADGTITGAEVRAEGRPQSRLEFSIRYSTLRPTRHIRWRVLEDGYTGPGEHRDRAPNVGWYRH